MLRFKIAFFFKLNTSLSWSIADCYLDYNYYCLCLVFVTSEQTITNFVAQIKFLCNSNVKPAKIVALLYWQFKETAVQSVIIKQPINQYRNNRLLIVKLAVLLTAWLPRISIYIYRPPKWCFIENYLFLELLLSTFYWLLRLNWSSYVSFYINIRCMTKRWKHPGRWNSSTSSVVLYISFWLPITLL